MALLKRRHGSIGRLHLTDRELHYGDFNDGDIYIRRTPGCDWQHKLEWRAFCKTTRHSSARNGRRSVPTSITTPAMSASAPLRRTRNSPRGANLHQRDSRSMWSIPQVPHSSQYQISQQVLPLLRLGFL